VATHLAQALSLLEQVVAVVVQGKQVALLHPALLATAEMALHLLLLEHL
jgi:hypothetical protein